MRATLAGNVEQLVPNSYVSFLPIAKAPPQAVSVPPVSLTMTALASTRDPQASSEVNLGRGSEPAASIRHSPGGVVTHLGPYWVDLLKSEFSRPEVQEALSRVPTGGVVLYIDANRRCLACFVKDEGNWSLIAVSAATVPQPSTALLANSFVGAADTPPKIKTTQARHHNIPIGETGLTGIDLGGPEIIGGYVSALHQPLLGGKTTILQSGSVRARWPEEEKEGYTTQPESLACFRVPEEVKEVVTGAMLAARNLVNDPQWQTTQAVEKATGRLPNNMLPPDLYTVVMIKPVAVRVGETTAQINLSETLWSQATLPDGESLSISELRLDAKDNNRIDPERLPDIISFIKRELEAQGIALKVENGSKELMALSSDLDGFERQATINMGDFIKKCDQMLQDLPSPQQYDRLANDIRAGQRPTPTTPENIGYSLDYELTITDV